MTAVLKISVNWKNCVGLLVVVACLTTVLLDCLEGCFVSSALVSCAVLPTAIDVKGDDEGVEVVDIEVEVTALTRSILYKEVALPLTRSGFYSHVVSYDNYHDLFKYYNLFNDVYNADTTAESLPDLTFVKPRTNPKSFVVCGLHFVFDSESQRFSLDGRSYTPFELKVISDKFLSMMHSVNSKGYITNASIDFSFISLFNYHLFL